MEREREKEGTNEIQKLIHEVRKTEIKKTIKK